mmetsp:Transcript_11457/g.32040  ORF Transcript_11457/g.32040 Transcript_11457/m.32040 type:complete len:231 (+) Transcript_11457:148-840(+)
MKVRKRQLNRAKRAPIAGMRSRSRACSLSPVDLKYKAKPMPSPMSMLNRGPAKHAVMAMLTPPSAVIAIAMFAMRSVRELPQARTVTPRTAGLMCAITPKTWMMPTSSSAMMPIQIAETMNPYMPIMAATHVRSSTCGCLVVAFHAATARMAPATAAMLAPIISTDSTPPLKYETRNKGDNAADLTNQDWSDVASLPPGSAFATTGMVAFSVKARGITSTSVARDNNWTI